MPRHSVQLTVLVRGTSNAQTQCAADSVRFRLGELLMPRHSVQLTVLDSG